MPVENAGKIEGGADQHFLVDDVADLINAHRTMTQLILSFQLFLSHACSLVVLQMSGGRLEILRRDFSNAGRWRQPDKLAGGASGRQFAKYWRGFFHRYSIDRGYGTRPGYGSPQNPCDAETQPDHRRNHRRKT